MKSYPFRSSGVRGHLLALAALAPICQLQAVNGTWNANAPGNWSDPTKWTGGVVASGSGAIADFSTLDITGDHIVTIDAPFTIGTLKSQDLTTLSNSWTFAGPGTLTMDNGGSTPVLDIINRAPTISASLASANGLSKTGAGLVTLSGNNSGLTGTLTLPNVTGTNGAGLVLSGTPSVGSITTINVNGTATTGQYLGLNGNITLGAGITLNLTSQGGNSGPPGAIRSEGGTAVTNIINGPININGAGVRIGNNASKLLELNGVITGGANGVTFRTAVNDGIHVTNTGNTWTGTTIHSEGILWFKPGALPPTSPLVIAASAAGTVHLSGTFNRPLGIGAGEVRLGGAETSVATRALGLSARGGDLSVNFGGAGAETFFADFAANNTGTATTINTNILALNATQADSKLTLANPLNNNGAARTLQINNNVVEFTGGLRGAAVSYTKTGAGTLVLSSASTWLGDLVVSSAADSANGGIVRLTHAEALGAPGTVKNVNAMGLNRGISIIELTNNIAIDANKSLRMWGKNLAMNGATGSGQQVSLRSVSGNNAWNGNVVIANSGGSYAMESLADTLTVGADVSTPSLVRNEVAASTRTMTLYGPGNFVIHNKIADNGAANIVLTKSGSGTLTLDRADNDFDTVPNLLVGTTQVSSLADAGIASSLGLGTSIGLGSTLRYTGGGSSSNREISLWPSGGTLDSSGSGSLALTSSTFSHNAGISGAVTTIAAPFDLGATALVLNETAGLVAGQTITGTNIPANTTITAVNPDLRTVTISQATSAASTTGVTVTLGSAVNLDRTLTLTGSNTGINSFAAPLSNPAGTGKLAVTKTGTGSWFLNGTAQTYTGPTLVSQGTLGFDGAFPAASALTVAPAATLSLANLQLRVNPDTGRALDIDGNLAIAGPVNIVLTAAAPTGTFPVLDYASITGTANLTSNYRVASFTGGATTASVTVGAGTPIIWTGASGSFWDTKASTNWRTAGNAPQTFFWGDPVRFDDSGSAAPTVDLDGELRPASVTIDASSTDYVFQGTGTLSGPFPLTKTGTSIATINGNHSFNGGITINGGILKPLTNQSLGGIGNDITVAAGGELDTNGAMTANRDYDATIAGSGTTGDGAIVNFGLDHVSGVGTLTLSANATIGGSGRWDVRPIVAGTGFVDLAGFTLTKTGANRIAFVDGTMIEPGSIQINGGTLALTRLSAGGTGLVEVNDTGMLMFENYTTGYFEKDLRLNQGGTIRLQGSNLVSVSTVETTGSGVFDIEAARTLTFQGALTGSGNLVKSASTGGLTLAGTNTYAGTTTINGGTLTIGSQATLGTLGAGAVTNNGALVINRPDTDYVLSNPIDGSGTLTIGQNAGGSFTSLVTVTGANTFAGNIAVASGGMKIFDAGALGTGPKEVALTNGTAGRPQFYLDGSGGNITLPATVGFRTSSTNTDQPAVGNLAGDNVIGGNFTITSGGGSTAISVFGGSLTLNGTVAPDTSNRRVILGGTTGTGTINGVISGTGGNAMGLDKVGSTVWTLTGANTYTGTTVITAGTLVVDGNQSTASGAVTVGTGATLGGAGTIGGTITAQAGSTVAPGTSIGTLTTTAPVTLSGSFAVELDGASADRLTVGGSLSLSGATLDVTALGAPGLPVYVIASYGLLNGTFASTNGIPAGYGINYNYNGLNQIALVSVSNPYGDFETTNGIAGAGSGTDSDGDGIANGIEFVIGGDPSGPNSDSSALMPTITTDATYLNFVFRRTDASASSDPYVQYGNDLAGWTEAQGGVNGVIIAEDNDFFGGSTDRVTVRIPRALALPGSKLFARLRVDIP